MSARRPLRNVGSMPTSVSGSSANSLLWRSRLKVSLISVGIAETERYGRSFPLNGNGAPSEGELIILRLLKVSALILTRRVGVVARLAGCEEQGDEPSVLPQKSSVITTRVTGVLLMEFCSRRRPSLFFGPFQFQFERPP